MTTPAIVAALGGLPVIICVILQFAKAKGLSPALVEPLAQGLGIVACLAYQLSVGISPDLAVAIAVGEIEGLASMKLYDKLKGTFTVAEIVQAEPLLAKALSSLATEIGKLRRHNEKKAATVAPTAPAPSATP